jgi:PAS domain S-box-containing protein
METPMQQRSPGECPISGAAVERPDPRLDTPRHVGELRPGHHVMQIYEQPEEQAVVAARFLAGALARAERGLLVAPSGAEARTLAALEEAGVDVEAERRRGALLVESCATVFLPTGAFEPDRQLERWAERSARARQDSFTGLAVAADMSWAQPDVPGIDALVGYEARLGLRLELAACALCQYDRDRFAPQILRALLASHALVVHQGSLLRNPYAEPPEVALGAEPAARQVDRLLGSMHEHALALQAAWESEQRLRTVVSAVTSGIVFKEPHAEILDFNPAAQRILGVTRDPATGRPSADPRLGSIHVDGSPYPLEEWPAMNVLRTGLPERNAIMGLVRPGGDVRWVRINAVPVSNPGAPPHAAVVSLDDITEERRAWVEVRRAEQQLRLAMECAGHAYWELDVATGHLVSGTPWTLLGYGEHPLDGSAAIWAGLIHPDDAPVMLRAYRAHVEGETPGFRIECRARAKDGAWRWVLVIGRAIARDREGRAARLAGTVTDVTESKRLDERLRQADRLVSVGTLAAGVAHEVNNPLAYLAANLAYLEESLAHGATGQPTEELRAAALEALDGVARVKAIVKGLSQFANPTRSEQRRPIDVRRQVEAAVALARIQVAARARLEVDLPDGLPAVVADEHEVSQVLVNLLVNAAQAIPEGRAAEHQVSVSARAEADGLLLEVRDTGTGMSAEVQARIFEPFFTTKSVGAGSGLGLSICHGIVRVLGGTIEVDSAPGRGSAFRVRLPAAPAAPEDVRPDARPEPAARARVLIVDDEPMVGTGLARLLGPTHEVTTLTSPAEVLRRACAGASWDVILCDLMMPELNGMELEAALVEARPDLVPRMLYLTGGAFTERSQAFLAIGRPFLEKPVAAADLRAAVSRIAGASRRGAAS